MSIKNKFKSLFAEDEYDYDYEYVEEEVPSQEQEIKTRSKKHQDQNVVSLKSVQTQTKVVLAEPRSYDETQAIADHIVNRRSVVINLQRVDHQQAKRIIDFLSGTVYAVTGQIQKLGPHTFLCTPDNVEITGNITQIVEDGYE